MNEEQLNGKPGIDFGKWVELVRLCGAYGITAERRYKFDPDHTTITQLERMKRALEAERFVLADETRRYVFQFWDRLWRWRKSAVTTMMYMTEGFGIFAHDENSSGVMDRFTDHTTWDWCLADFEIEKKKFLKGIDIGSEEECLSVTVCSYANRYGETDEWKFSIPLRYLDPEYDLSKDIVFTNRLYRFERENEYDRMFRGNTPEQEMAVMDVLRNHPYVMKLIEDAVGMSFDHGA